MNKTVEDELAYRWNPGDDDNPPHLPNIKVKLYPIYRDGLIPKDHEYSFQAPGTDTRICLMRYKETKNLINLFKRSGNNSHVVEEQERKWLEKELGYNLNPYDSESILHTYKVIVPNTIKNTPIELDLRNPSNYLDFLILSSANNVAPLNATNGRSNLRYKYYMETDDFTASNKKSKTNYTIKAVKYLGAMENSIPKMRNFYKVLTGNTMSPNIGTEAASEKLMDEINKDARKFVETRENPSYQMQEFIVTAVEVGAIVHTKGQFFYNENPLAFDGDKAELGNTIRYLNNAQNQAIKADIQAKIDIANS